MEPWKQYHYAAFTFDALGNYAAPALASAMAETAKGTTAAVFPEGRRPYFRLKIDNCTGTVWFDEASLVEVQR